MNRFIVLSFLVMAWGYYELSGGADFVPETRPAATTPALTPDSAPTPAPAGDLIAAAPADPLEAVAEVTRADTEALDALPEPASATPDALSIDATSVADALNQALAEPVAEPAPETVTETASAQPAATAADLREVTGDTVNLRDGPGTNFGVLDRLTRGTVVSVLDTAPGGWVYIEVNGRTGWMSADFIGPAI